MLYTKLFLVIGFDFLLNHCTYDYSLTSELENLFSNVHMIDFSKAFDSVDHVVLMSKLVQLNLPTFVINWICSFLAGRGQHCAK